ncbi:hypothetical protein FPOAC1_002388 [Fusarium poae]|uniref:hypothetical protein n=1 Tax=Fusarium poae TaxID=36050 RepID=UPI001CEB8847|nr:hypothetical protein FPOAC1_002388 [Fusarium poae]KAG8676385.1 hypothetical protein FPOAC1_002388 [Fusarium poae]
MAAPVQKNAQNNGPIDHNDLNEWKGRFNDVLARPSEHVNSKSPETSQPWQNSFFGCFSPISLCAITCCVPCVTFGKTHHRLQKNSNLQGYEPVNTSCLMFWASTCVGLHWIPLALQRANLREKHNLQGSCLVDLATACCCGCCDLIQQDKEAEYREAQSVATGEGYKANEGQSCDIYTFVDETIVPSTPPKAHPYLLVNIGSGVSFFQVTENNQCQRISGSSFGGSALCGLLLLLTRARTYEDMLEQAEKGNNANVDKLIGDIYGMDYNRIGMKMTAVASTFCKAFSLEHRPEAEVEAQSVENTADIKSFSDADICHSLVFAVFNNIGQLATLHSRIHGNPDIYFTGPYVQNCQLLIKTLCIAVRYYSQGEKKAHVVVNQGQAGDLSV